MTKNDAVNRFTQIGGAILLAFALFSAGMNVGLWGLREENKELKEKIEKQTELETNLALLSQTVGTLAKAVTRLEAKLEDK